MGKKEKNKKKGKGAEKTADKTEKKIKIKLKKTTGEDDIESVVKAIEEEERKRQEVKEVALGEKGPSHRSNFSFVVHPENPELVLFGGEFYNGQKTELNNELLHYDIKRKSWKQVKSPAGPAPRCSHQAVVSAQAGGQMWVLGGEYASPSESQFHHYKDLWVFHFNSRRWEKIVAKDGPSSRSGHRMVLFKRHLIVFGGFHDNPLRGESKYFNDVHSFDMQEMKWKQLDISGVKPPAPRSGSNMFTTADNRIVIYGGYCKEKVKSKVTSGKKAGGSDSSKEVGKTLDDMFLLVPDKHDESLTKWRWHNVKQTGNRPNPRSGIASTVVPNTCKAFFFGGVNDEANDSNTNDDEDDDDMKQGNFYSDLYICTIENEKATWQKVELTGIKDEVHAEKKRRRGNSKIKKNVGTDNQGDNDVSDDDESDADELDENAVDVEAANTIERLEIDNEGKTTKDDRQVDQSGSSVRVVEDGAFTISSTIIHSSSEKGEENKSNAKSDLPQKGLVNYPSPRFGSSIALRQSILYLFGGMFEDEEDRQLTFRDFYSLDIRKLDTWQTLIESDIKTMEWFESEDDEDDEDEDSEDSDDSDEMDVN